MKHTHSLTTFAIILAFSSNAFSHNNVTNIFSKVELGSWFLGEIGGAMQDITSNCRVRICSDDATFRDGTPMAFTNASLGYILDTVVNNSTNHIWRYEEVTDTIYVHPTTNAVSMMRCGPFSVTNVLLKTFVENNIGFHNIGGAQITQGSGPAHWRNAKITLEMGESYVWEVLDAICVQIPVNNYSWHIQELKPGDDVVRYVIYLQITGIPLPSQRSGLKFVLPK